MKQEKIAVATIRDGVITFLFIDDLETEHTLTLDEFLELADKESLKVYFHSFIKNGSELTPHLLNSGYTSLPASFKTIGKYKKAFIKLTNEDGMILKVTVKSKRRQVQFYDSKRILNFSEEQLKHDFNLNGDDLQVVAQALTIMFNEGHTSNSISQNAMNSFLKIKFSDYRFKEGQAVKMFNRTFPTHSEEADELIRRSYKGGWCYLNEKYKGVRGVQGLTYDVNSLYPSVMESAYLPVNEGIEYFGDYQEDPRYPLFIQEIVVDYLILKDKAFPFLTSDHTLDKFLDDEYITRCVKPLRLVLTSVDLEMLKKYYNFGKITSLRGIKFQCSNKIFKEYIDHYRSMKENNTGAKRQIAKLFLNSLYGKFGAKRYYRDSYFKLNEDGFEERVLLDKYENKGAGVNSYPAMASFITAYARQITIESAIANYETFVYADTDSLHLATTDQLEVEQLKIDDKKFGYWKLEKQFDDSLFLDLKCYAEHDKNGWEFTVAGLPSDAQEELTIDQFFVGSKVRYLIATRTKKGYEAMYQFFTIGAKRLGKTNFKKALHNEQ